MINLPRQIKLDLFNLIKKETSAFGQNDSDTGLIPFLVEIWDLTSMPSQDGRFVDAEGDIFQHTVNNDDWDIDYLFIDRLKLLDDEDDTRFVRFIETVLNPRFRKDEDEIVKFVLLINPYLERHGAILVITSNGDEGTIYKIHLKEFVGNIPPDTKINDIVFFAVSSLTKRSNNNTSHTRPNIFPCFVLVFNHGWNDYSMKTAFSLFYYNNAEVREYIGETKIIYLDEVNTFSVIEKVFTSLSDDFCSLGQSEDFYSNLKNIFKKDFESILYALKDCAFFPKIQEEFDQTSAFKNSLIRWDDNEKLLREIKYILYGYDLTNLYKFKYSFQPLFAETSIDVDFDFNNKDELPSRIYALIGKNGTGKTQLITSLPINISKKNNTLFVPKTPLFSKVIAVSYSIFDKFEIPKKTSTFNYLYCGLRNEKGEELTERGLVLRFHNTWKRIETIEKTDKWKAILSNFMEQEMLDEFIIPNPEKTTGRNNYQVSMEGFNKIKNRLSSGQSIILYIITEIVANIRYDSLLLYDEPETHLHPNAITQLMNTIYELVHEFQSYCIIATHSPLVIRELFSKNVYVIERNENIPSVKRIGIESFGENLTTLTEEVFGNKNVPKQYKKIIEELIKNGKSFDDIISLLEFDDVPLSLNARLYIKSVITKTNEES